MNVSGVLTSLPAGLTPSAPQNVLQQQREGLFQQLAKLQSAKGDPEEKAKMAKRIVGMIKTTDQQLRQTQITDQYRAMADAQQKLLDETENMLIQSAKKRKDDGVLVSASLRRILSANYKYNALAKADGGQMGSDMAEDIQKDLAAANKLGAEAAELARRKRQEQFGTDLKKAAKLKHIEAEKQKASEAKAADKEAELEKERIESETAEKEARKRKRKLINVMV